MAEVAIGCALVAVACIGAVSLLGDNIQGAFFNTHDTFERSMSSQAAKNQASRDEIASLPSSQNSPRSVPVENVPQDGLELTHTMPSALSYGNYPHSLNQQIETAGANGSTSMLLATLDSVIQQAVANQTITEAQANQLRALSQQGHAIGNIEGQIETIINQKGNMTQATNLASLIGFEPTARQEGSEIQKMRQLLSQAQSVGALNDPQLDSAVNILTNQIINIANGVEGATFQIQQGTLKAGETYTSKVIEGLIERDNALNINTQQTLQTLSASDTTHQQAAQICQAVANGQPNPNCRP